MRNILLTVLFLFSCAFLAADETDVIFCIGTPDSHCSEFALVKEGYAAYPNKFPNDVLYEVGKSNPKTDFPFVHPAPADQSWAKGKPNHPFTIRFNSDQDVAEPTALVIGTIASLRSSEVHINVNGTALPLQTASHYGNHDIVFQPRTKGEPRSMLFAVPANTFKKGTNTITITLDKESWVLYDYVALRKELKPLAIRHKEETNLFAQFRSGENAPLKDVKQIVFAVRPMYSEHWYANFGYYADDEVQLPTTLRNVDSVPYKKGEEALGGKLILYDLDTKETKILLDDPAGTVRDPQVHYNGQKVIFSYRPAETKFFHLYEMELNDPKTMKQLTFGDFDDIEPVYTPEDKIVFVSSRGNRWVNCWLTQVAILYGCDADGKNIHPLSGNNEQDNTPWVLPNGQILYTRWEYVDRSQVHYHHLWTMNPDGTRQMVFYGNMHPGIVFIDAKPILNSDKIVASFSWGHGQADHAGSVGVIDPRLGPDDQSAMKTVSSGSNFRDPWAFSEEHFLAARGFSMVLLNGDGEEQDIYTLPKEWRDKNWGLHEPRPVIVRQKERIVGDATNPEKTTGQLTLIDVYQGRNMQGIKRGEIKKLLILETLPMPIHFTGGMEPMTYGGSFTLERIVGTVPVDPDGSANFELPALRGFFFVALDENDLAVKRMQSFLSVMPGEKTACIGCHEERTASPPAANFTYPTAMRRAPSKITPIASFRGIDAFGNPLLANDAENNIPDVLDYPRDVQPILDKHCVQCHCPEKREGNVSLIGNRSPLYSISYFTMTAKSLVADGRNLAKSNYPPRTLGSGASRLMQLCDGSHYGTKLSDREKTIIRLWCDTGATYLGTYAGLGCGMVGGYARNFPDKQDQQWSEVQAMTKTLQENCVSCHKEKTQLPLSASEEIGGPPWINLRPDDVRRKFARHLLYDLTEPERSVLLLAPLAKSAGGYESCGSAILAGKDDLRYQTILSGIERTKRHLDEIKRFDMPGFVPRPQYIREMKKYGILSSDADPASVVDFYQLDHDYWRSLWHQPVQH